MEGGREVAMKVEARMTCYDGRDGGIGLVATIDGGAMLCVLDLAVWAEAEQSLGLWRLHKLSVGWPTELVFAPKEPAERGSKSEAFSKKSNSKANNCRKPEPDATCSGATSAPGTSSTSTTPDQDEAEATEQEEDDTTTPINEEVMPEVRPIINDIEPDQQPFRRSKRLAEKRGAELYWVSAEALEDVERRIEASVDEEEEWWDALEVQTLDEAIVADPSVVIEASWKEEKEAEEERRLRQILWDDDPSPQIEVYALDDVLDRAVRNEAQANMVPDPLPTKLRLTPSPDDGPVQPHTSSRYHEQG
ncbi:hypothetical protein RhiJN_27293 [Ceratobasidium sp. AG-Ba]|nr:hypothetical protein RhiJN_27293 [Ceratobasidium sp. AG-Ba]